MYILSCSNFELWKLVNIFHKFQSLAIHPDQLSQGDWRGAIVIQAGDRFMMDLTSNSFIPTRTSSQDYHSLENPNGS
jgi:hypothetical protein